MASCIIAQCTVTRPADAADEYERTAARLVDAVDSGQDIILMAGGRSITGCLHAQSHDTFRVRRWEFTPADVEAAWDSQDGQLIVEVSFWNEWADVQRIRR